MKGRLPRHIGTLAIIFSLAGCAVPPNASEQAGDTALTQTSLRTSAVTGKNGKNDAGTPIAGIISRTGAGAPLSFDNALATLPADDSAHSTLSNAKPLDVVDVSDFHQTGKASWYGRFFHGRRTANGDRFDMNDLTAAHRTLPLSSYVRVTNQANGKSVVVKINDRGPFARGRVLDLSYAAAKVIGLVRSGVARVKIEGLSAAEAREARNDDTLASTVK